MAKSTTNLHFDAILFDMDGTLVDSAAGVEGAWNLFREAYPSIDVHDILSSSHGIRTVDNLRKHCGINDPVVLEREAVRFEEAIVSSASEGGRAGIVLLPGVKPIIEELASQRFLPKPRWAICTSATREYATSALNSAGILIPDVFITSEDVDNGKPHPDPFLRGAEKCGADPSKCLVLEDSPNGIRSGREAGCKTIGLLTTHSKDQVEAAKPDIIVKDLSAITMKLTDEGVKVTVTMHE
ncbi:HAD-like domain-containing protein [Crepidotus variabilis]|uniref:HAD-like domain-containing protein n=1 Tax=Crepidotus variabilis TaxID=179855 RepID=A0A9P6JWM3_9AGAR|nr:HAD-like domain-containing protein [Crepidotus variabilis]